MSCAACKIRQDDDPIRAATDDDLMDGVREMERYITDLRGTDMFAACRDLEIDRAQKFRSRMLAELDKRDEACGLPGSSRWFLDTEDL